jgi:hypothetical protein
MSSPAILTATAVPIDTMQMVEVVAPANLQAGE